MKNLVLIFGAFLIGGLLLVGCGGGASEEASTNDTEATAAPEAEAPSMVELTITGNDAMKYSKDRMEVTAGQKVSLTLIHEGQLPKESMGHNWVLLEQGTNLEEFALGALEYADNDYIPTEKAGIIVHTEMIGGGAMTTIEFEAPAAGEYDFLCTFPGHYGFMKGKFVVK